jgi:hypothetical protein
MQEIVSSPLSAWESFYVIIGSSAAALTGLQFVVIALVAEANTRSSTDEIDAFATPTIVHFGAVLLLSAILSAPWHALATPGYLLGATALAGLGYTGLIIRRARRQTGYRTVLEDWLFHAIFPLLAYATLLVAGIALARGSLAALFIIGASALLLLFIGIHNAWDTVTYIAVERLQGPSAAPSPAPELEVEREVVLRSEEP